MTIKILIADDEPLAREELARLLGQDRDFEVVAQVGNGNEALQSLKDRSDEIDVVFLDIDMPGKNGLEVASYLAAWPHPPCIVFATAFNQYAVDAFEANAIDYLLKPYDADRFAKTLSRLKDYFKEKTSQRDKLLSLEQDLVSRGMLKKIIGHHRNSKDRKVVDPHEIYFFYAQNTEVYAQLADDQLIIKSTLKELTGQLNPEDFVQTHKSYLINVNHIKKVAPMFSGNFEISLNLANLPKVPLSRRYAKALKDRLGGW